MDGFETDQLLCKVAKGDNSAFEELYLKTSKGVYAFIYSYLKNAHDTEDALQTVYLKIKMNISSYRAGTNGRAWIFQIAKNQALTQIKQNSRVEDVEKSPSDGFAKTEITDAMQRVLTEEEQRIIVLHVLWGYKHREIATLLECPTGTVTSKYKRALEKMRDALKENV
ncbi:MAG: RNA polymerase sigma factor [Clostridia bacterium]|nr:RNA polymerase sigma factor [Clostridia bacterium]